MTAVNVALGTFIVILVGICFGAFLQMNLPKRYLRKETGETVKLAAGVIAAMLPDADVLAFALHIPYADAFGHRGASHSLLFAGVLAALAAVLAFFGNRRSWSAPHSPGSRRPWSALCQPASMTPDALCQPRLAPTRAMRRLLQG